MRLSRLAAASWFAAVFAAALVGTGCKKDGGKAAPIASASADLGKRGPAVSCNLLDQAGTCTEYRSGSSPVEKSLCEGLKGRYGDSTCPGEGRVGSCAMGADEHKHYYKTFVELRSFTAEEAKADCESELIKGRYTPYQGPPPAKPARSTR